SLALARSVPAPVTAPPPFEDAAPTAIVTQRGGISLDQAIRLASERYPGRVVRAETTMRGGRTVHEVRILMEGGGNARMRIVRIGPESGRSAEAWAPIRPVLLVEDEQALSRSLAAQLERAGFTVQHAPDGREGLYYAREYPVDVAIVDLGLPGLSGVELIRGVRANGKDFPILVLTARDRWQDKVEALKLGADDYVVKPFHVEELLARVEAL